MRRIIAKRVRPSYGAGDGIDVIVPYTASGSDSGRRVGRHATRSLSGREWFSSARTCSVTVTAAFTDLSYLAYISASFAGFVIYASASAARRMTCWLERLVHSTSFGYLTRHDSLPLWQGLIGKAGTRRQLRTLAMDL